MTVVSTLRPRMPGTARLRLASGLVLMAYAASHLGNHALGLVSLAAMERGRLAFVAFWRLPPVEVLLLAALLAHVALALWGLWARRAVRMRPGELFHVGLGLMVPFWLMGHILATGVIHRLTGVDDTYTYVLSNIWPQGLVSYTLLLAIVWSHGAIGTHRWLRLKPWYRPLRGPAVALAVLFPVLALAGTLAGGREWGRLEADAPQRVAELARAQGWPSHEQRQALTSLPGKWLEQGFVALLAALLVARGGRWLHGRRRTLRLTYPGGRTVAVPRGVTVLEASRMRAIPHASVCGGKGRCSTCRVRVAVGAAHLPPPDAEERRVLRRIAAPPDVRLGCQLRPVADLTVTPLMPAEVGTAAALAPMDPSRGTERVLAVLFADLRGFTQLSEGRLPYDVVFILNRYFAAMGAAIERHDGHIDKFIGDGVMAWFGLDAPAEVASRRGLAAARAMGEALAGLNRDLAVELDRPLRMGIGLHLGPAIVGEMGYAGARGLTVIGDTVNVASRLESLCKEHAAELVVSDELVHAAGLDLDGAARHVVVVRGRDAGLTVRVIASTASLPEEAEEPARPPAVSGFLRALRLGA